MYLIRCEQPRRIKQIFDVLSKVYEITVRETKFSEYLFVDTEPTNYIPEHLQKGVTIEPFEGRYTRFIKDAGLIRDLLDRNKPVPCEEGDMVRILAGTYKNFKGIILEANTNEYLIEVDVFGTIPLKTTCKRKEVEKVDFGQA